MNEQDRIWILIARRLADEATAEELKELQELMQKHPEMTYSMQVLADLWRPSEPRDETEAEKAFARHQQRLNQHLQKASTPHDTPTHNPDTRQKSPHYLQEANDPQSRQRAGSAISDERKMALATAQNGPTAWNGVFSNALKVSWRNLLRNKGFSLLNILGLSIGMASALLIFLWIGFQFSVDQFHTKKDRIYQVFSRAAINGTIECWGATPMVMAPLLKTEYPVVEETSRLIWVGAFVFSAGDKHLQTSGHIVDPAFLKIFSYPLLKGDPNTALQAEHSVVLTEKMAKKLFGDADAMGQNIRVDSNALFTVTGILKDYPANSRFTGDYLIPWNYMKEVHWYNPDWAASYGMTFVLLKDGVDEKMGNDRLRNVIKAHNPNVKNELFLHPLRKWQLYSNFENGVNTGGEIHFVRIFGFIAGMILLIACINYMNLSTAQSGKRAREVGIRKTVGAGKGSLVGQFLGESIGISFIAGLLALVIIQPGLAVFNRTFDASLSVPFGDLSFWLAAIGFILLTGMIAGSYPAFYLSSFKPLHVLKGIFKGAHNLVTPRTVLVVLQFTVAIVLIISTLVIFHQIDYAQKRDAGYDRGKLAYVYIKGDIRRNYPLIRKALFNSGVATSVTRTNSPITDIWNWEDTYSWPGKDTAGRYEFARYLTYSDLVRTMGLHLVAGRDIDVGRWASDTSAVLLNESAVNLMRLKDPLGKEIVNKFGTCHIVGVVKDFVPLSPYNSIPPIVCQGSVKDFGTLTFRMSAAEDNMASREKIKAIFTKYNPDYPFEFYTVNKTYRFKFEGEQDFGLLAAVFAGLTILISCLGLFGLAASVAESRVKEIGVRKVLGASVSTIATLLSKDFLKWVLISFVFASPLAWWTMHGWLQNFSYRAEFSWWIFAAAGSLSLLIAALTVSYQAVKAALASPVKSLRSE